MNAGSGDNNNNIDSQEMTQSPLYRGVSRVVNIPTVVDKLPVLLNIIVTNGKMAALGLLGAYFLLVALWFPFWLLTFLLTEIGVYVFLVLSVFFLGRIIIRLLAFPGSSSRIPAEIETEFARYSVKMVQTAATCIIDLCSALLSTSAPGRKSQNSLSYFDVPGLWSRAQSYRDRVLGMYLDVLTYLYREPGSGVVSANETETRYGNNPISGDIGNLMGLTEQARSDGKTLMTLLRKVLTELDSLSGEVTKMIRSADKPTSPRSLSEEGRQMAKSLSNSATELRDIVSSFKPQSQSDQSDVEMNGDMDDDEDVSMEAVRRRLETENESAMDAAKNAAAAILPLIDPPPHSSIFGMDVLRGSVLSRYRGAKQMWIPRPAGGRLDAMFIPSLLPQADGNQKALLYCNPNAGLIEVATGMGLAGGNVMRGGGSKTHPSWVDFYTQEGYDVYLFNYAGFGRSDGKHIFSIGNPTNARGFFGAICRILHYTFLTFKPTPESLRDDARIVGAHVISTAGYNSLVIHGESIGGLAAAGAARGLCQSPATKDKLSLLICDRTFCNLEATAQRLVGGWTGPAMRALAPFWNTDVAGDFLAASCPKLVANDAADAIIADVSSLKSGISLCKEARKGASTEHLGWTMEAPLTYRMSDWENVGVNESSYVKPTHNQMHKPVWPTDKQITLEEGFHFAACVRRIGKVATAERKKIAKQAEEGFEVDGSNVSESDAVGNESAALFAAWKMLSCCDGLCGTPLGFAVKNGYDCVVSWLCCALILGGQRVAEAAETRLAETKGPILPGDFDTRHSGYQDEEGEVMVHPKPLPEVIEALKAALAIDCPSMKAVEYETKYCISMLEYVVARLSSAPSVEASRRSINFGDSLGVFLDLNCGHNNPYSEVEKFELKNILARATTTH